MSIVSSHHGGAYGFVNSGIIYIAIIVKYISFWDFYYLFLEESLFDSPNRSAWNRARHLLRFLLQFVFPLLRLRTTGDGTGVPVTRSTACALHSKGCASPSGVRHRPPTRPAAHFARKTGPGAVPVGSAPHHYGGASLVRVARSARRPLRKCNCRVSPSVSTRPRCDAVLGSPRIFPVETTALGCPLTSWHSTLKTS